MKLISLGWSPDVSDLRDHTVSPGEVGEHPPNVDLRETDLELEPPTTVHKHASCSVSILSMLDWQSRKWKGERINGSADFLHQLAVRTTGGGGATGVSIRSTLKTLRRYGAPPTDLCQSVQFMGDLLNNPELFGFSREFETIQFFRLDLWSQEFPSQLAAMKNWIVGGNPFLLGFAVPNNFTYCKNYIPFDVSRGGTMGGTVGVVVGYNDDYPLYERLKIGHMQTENQGAFLIRTFWQDDWGRNDYFWLPYTFIKNRFACDAWAVRHP